MSELESLLCSALRDLTTESTARWSSLTDRIDVLSQRLEDSEAQLQNLTLEFATLVTLVNAFSQQIENLGPKQSSASEHATPIR